MSQATATVPGAKEQPGPTPVGPDGQAARLTLRALAGSALGVLPLLQLLTDSTWLIQAWISMAIVIVPAALLRLRRAPHLRQLLPGIILLVGYLTRLYLSAHAWFGVIPSRETWADLRAASRALGHTVHDSAAPLHSTGPIRLYLSLGLVALAIVVDILVVQLHRPALVGVPLLLIFTLSGAIPRDPVNWIWFALAGGGYLLVLSSRSLDELQSWGRVVARPERATRLRLTSGLSGRRIAVAAIAVAVLVPFVLPLGSVNLIANALHNGQVGVGGNGKGSTGVVIDPLATLRGELTRGSPVNLFTVDVSGEGAKSAFYLRSAVLENYTGKAWVQGPVAATSPATGALSVAPATFGNAVATSQFSATINVSKLAGTGPLFATPNQLGNIPASWSWSSRYGIIVGNVNSGLRYTETVAQPNPSTDILEASRAVPRGAPGGQANSVLQDNLALDAKVPTAVTDLVTTITAGKTTPYDKARALSTYFTDPTNGFVYSLQTKSGESGSDLVDFLTTGKAGFCQQYAAALGVMLRVAGIPARVVLGYTHPAPDASGRFVVTSDDAHAWVEAYFTGIGWLPFDPTPLTGADAARAVALPWAPHTTLGSNASDADKPTADNPTAGTDPSATDATGATGATSADSANESNLVSIGLAVVVLLAVIASAVPWVLRTRRRRQRLRRSRDSGPEPLWDELADTVRDLGLGWSSARSTRQVAAWLGEHLLLDSAREALTRLAGEVERQRYSLDPLVPGGTDHTDRPDRSVPGWRDDQDWRRAVEELALVRSGLAADVTRRVRWRARLLPTSLWISKNRAAEPDEGSSGLTRQGAANSTR